MSRRLFYRVLLIVIVVVGVLGFTNTMFAQGRSEEALEHVIAVQEKHTPALMALDGVVGTAVGLNQDNRATVKVFTVRGQVNGIPGMIDGVLVQPVVTGEFYALPKPDGPPGQDKKPPKEPDEPIDPTARFDRPVPIGVSCGHPGITAGTISCRVTDGTNVYVLSNNHVLANENSAGIGDNVLQPGPFDGGIDDIDAIGTLFDFEPILFLEDDPSYINTIDAAIALSSTSDLGNATPADGYGMPRSTTMEAYLNQAVKKYGRTTSLTKGRVYAINATVDVGYSSGTACFIGQIIITPGGFSAGGDSGSLIVASGKGRNKADDCKPVGLLFAGSDLFTIANPIDAVLDRFEVTIDGD